MNQGCTSSSAAVKEMLRDTGKTQKWLADETGTTKQNISNRLKKGTLSADEFIVIAKMLGFQVSLEKMSEGRYRGMEIIPSDGAGGRRLKQMVDGVCYDTGKSKAICHTEEHSGWKMELFADEEGRYFAAHYTDWENTRDYITPCPESVAAQWVLSVKNSENNQFFD